MDMIPTLPVRTDLGNKRYRAYTLQELDTSFMHWHTHFQLDLILDGDGVQIINGKTYPMRRGSMIIISPLDFHKNTIPDGSFVSVSTVKFSLELFQGALSELCSLEDFPVIQILSEEDFLTAKTLFSLLLNEQQKESSLGREVFADNLIEQLVILALRAAGRSGNATEKTFVRKALLYIHHHFRRDLKAAEVADFLGYSPNYFSSCFKKETGIAFQNYLSGLRLDFAMKLLKMTDYSVTDVCLESGFNTLQHFSQAFKKRFGVLPGTVKKESRERVEEQS